MRAVEEACEQVYTHAQEEASRTGMGCTLTALLIAGSKAIMAHVGDTRLYLHREGELHQLSTDHTMVADLMRAGVFTAEQAQGSRYAHVLTRSVGTQASVQVEKLVLDVLPCDRFVICSDGLSDYLFEQQHWFREQLEQQPLEDLPSSLIQFANNAGGHDNITVVAVDALPDDEAGLNVEMPPGSQTGVDLATVREVFLFRGLSLAQMSRVMNICVVQTLRDGEHVMSAGGLCDRMIIVMEGEVNMERVGAEPRLVGVGEHIGAMTLLHPCQCRFSLVASGRTRVLSIERAAFRRLLQIKPRLGIVLLERLGREVSLELSQANDLTEHAFAAVEGMEPT